MKPGVYVSKCGECICEYIIHGDSCSSIVSYGGDYFPMNIAKLRKFFIYLGEL